VFSDADVFDKQNRAKNHNNNSTVSPSSSDLPNNTTYTIAGASLVQPYITRFYERRIKGTQLIYLVNWSSSIDDCICTLLFAT